MEEQMASFKSATHVVAAHGAGLTNLVFCRPETKVLEIHVEGYVNWCYRCICAIYGLSYAFVYGYSSTLDTKSIHSSKYHLSIEKLEKVLNDTDFLTV